MVLTKLKELENAKIQLKKEFVGLDTIIDQIIDTISAWYVTPNLINRPVVVSIWGMTGTGKTSLVRRLVEILGLRGDTMFFDCGKCVSDNTDIVQSIAETFGRDTEEDSKDLFIDGQPIFVFDEFQFAKTINESREEDIRPTLRPIWSLLDSGILDLTERYDWLYIKFSDYVTDLEYVANKYPDMPVYKGFIKDCDDVKLFLDELGYIYFPDRNTLNQEPAFKLLSKKFKDSDSESEKEEADPYRPISILTSDYKKLLVKRGNSRGLGKGKEALESFLAATTLMECFEILRKEKNSNRTGARIDCSNSLIFVIGNLDEAFTVSNDINPDMDADVFYEMTKGVTIREIKQALFKRFRPEQVSRLGNNLIKYPTLNRECFKKIIDLEVARILSSFEIKITVTENLKELLYYEGVYPTQGVRPVFSTIGTILTPFLSRLKIELDASDEEVNMDVKCDNSQFRSSTAKILLSFYPRKFVKEFPIKLQLGELRDPSKKKRRFIISVHEIGHSILYAWRKGKTPNNIFSVSSDSGGFCSTYDKDSAKEIFTRREVDDHVMISMAGYLAEEIIFGEHPELLLMGSSSDFNDMWNMFAEKCFSMGYFEPVMFASRETDCDSGPIPGGQNPATQLVRYFDGTSFHDCSVYSLEEAMKLRIASLRKETTEILKKEIPLIKAAALELGSSGHLTGDRFLELIDKHGTVLSADMMNTVREKLSDDYYFKVLMK